MKFALFSVVMLALGLAHAAPQLEAMASVSTSASATADAVGEASAGAVSAGGAGDPSGLTGALPLDAATGLTKDLGQLGGIASAATGLVGTATGIVESAIASALSAVGVVKGQPEA